MSAALPRIARRWDALAAPQLRAELDRLAVHAEHLAEQVADLQRRLATAEENADWNWENANTYRQQADELIADLRRAGIRPHVPRIGITRDGQMGLLRSAA